MIRASLFRLTQRRYTAIHASWVQLAASSFPLFQLFVQFCQGKISGFLQLFYLREKPLYDNLLTYENTEEGIEMIQCDIVIAGAGVIGSAVARELSRFEGSIAVLEKNADVSKAPARPIPRLSTQASTRSQGPGKRK